MIEPSEIDRLLVQMPSMRALKSFVAAARYQNFTRAAESMSVTQAAISRQIRELEDILGIELFTRSGRAIELTEAGRTLFNATYLSFMNIAESTDRIRSNQTARRELRICASPIFSSLWLARRMPDFFNQNSEIDVNIMSTDDFASIGPADKPDVLVSMNPVHKENYQSIRLFHERIYPVCTPKFLANYPAVASIEGLKKSRLLELSPFRRAQITEHIDWRFWFRLVGFPAASRDTEWRNQCRSNNYNIVLRMALAHQGVALGWDHLVRPLVDEGRLVRPVEAEAVLVEKPHYLFYDSDIADNADFIAFKNWFLACLGITEPT